MITRRPFVFINQKQNGGGGVAPFDPQGYTVYSVLGAFEKHAIVSYAPCIFIGQESGYADDGTGLYPSIGIKRGIGKEHDETIAYFMCPITYYGNNTWELNAKSGAWFAPQRIIGNPTFYYVSVFDFTNAKVYRLADNDLTEPYKVGPGVSVYHNTSITIDGETYEQAVYTLNSTRIAEYETDPGVIAVFPDLTHKVLFMSNTFLTDEELKSCAPLAITANGYYTTAPVIDEVRTIFLQGGS